jgi:hypothetical protein
MCAAGAAAPKERDWSGGRSTVRAKRGAAVRRCVAPRRHGAVYKMQGRGCEAWRRGGVAAGRDPSVHRAQRALKLALVLDLISAAEFPFVGLPSTLGQTVAIVGP